MDDRNLIELGKRCSFAHTLLISACTVFILMSVGWLNDTDYREAIALVNEIEQSYEQYFPDVKNQDQSLESYPQVVSVPNNEKSSLEITYIPVPNVHRFSVFDSFCSGQCSIYKLSHELKPEQISEYQIPLKGTTRYRDFGNLYYFYFSNKADEILAQKQNNSKTQKPLNQEGNVHQFVFLRHLTQVFQYDLVPQYSAQFESGKPGSLMENASKFFVIIKDDVQLLKAFVGPKERLFTMSELKGYFSDQLRQSSKTQVSILGINFNEDKGLVCCVAIGTLVSLTMFLWIHLNQLCIRSRGSGDHVFDLPWVVFYTDTFSKTVAFNSVVVVPLFLASYFWITFLSTMTKPGNGGLAKVSGSVSSGSTVDNHVLLASAVVFVVLVGTYLLIGKKLFSVWAILRGDSVEDLHEEKTAVS